MVDWAAPAVNGRVVLTIQAEIFICMGIFFTDNVRFARFDYSLLRGRRSHRLAQIPYFASKLFWWSYMVSCLVFLYTYTEIDCDTVMAWIEAQMGWVAVASSALLACRAVCVFSGRARTAVSVALVVLTAGTLAAWMAGVKDVVSVWLPGAGPEWVDGQCSYVSVHQRYIVKYLITTAYDLVVLLLTVFGLMSFKGGPWIGQLLIEQGILYFAATLLANMVVTALTLANLSPSMSLAGAVPSSLVCVMCSTRLYAQLAEEVSNRNQYGSAGVSSFNSRKAKLSGTSSGFATSSTGTGSKQADKGPTVIMLKSVDNRSTSGDDETPAEVAHFTKVDAHSASTDDIEAQQHRMGQPHPYNGVWIEETTHRSVSESYP
ncbi:uncharacterized protein PFL1_03796 [Pseudozyma flocculosa PF-1]|uniref:Uncharacterized protein n=2 Tax=Pseudozyma flocculosa TaxID=84751 RepID=A0A5C3EVW6_9BASI|nr:uncharacterized protein PFL1_03796 [Pseudozyma flocculosa PF-1]EPQ28493.1 hypothetical protein PFL1_03796 [Pseudozyma flocculosa PF-1]SPO36413.1 uncharacterized protein PSFLO_01884 [Pseudozyma flocculosa]